MPPACVATGGEARPFRGELRDLALRGIDIDGGASDVVLELPSTSARVPVRIAGGASQLTIRRPADVPVRLEIHGGASRLALDARRLGSVGGDTVLESAEAERKGGRYDIVVSGGASDLFVQRG